MNFADLRSLLYYVQDFRGKVFVIAIDGQLVHTPYFNNLLLDIAVFQALNIKAVVAFGARHQIREMARERGVTLSSDSGMGVTDAATLEVCVDAISRMTHEFMRHLTNLGLRAAVSNSLIAHPTGLVNGVDWEFTGRVEKVDVASLNALIQDGMIPLIPPLAYDGRGHTLRLNSDAAAMEVALALKAEKILFVSEEAFVLPDGKVINQLSIEEAKGLAKETTAEYDTNLSSKLLYAARACLEGVPRVHIVDGKQEEVLLREVFSLNGVGTMIHQNDYQQIRPMQAKDVPEVLAMMQQAVEDSALVSRTREDIMQKLDDYFILEVDGNVVGSAALHLHGPEIGELACLYVMRAYKNYGYGKRLVTFIEEKARVLGCKKLFALSTQAYSFFENKMGYRVADPSVLPEPRRSQYHANGRKSRVLMKELAMT